MSSVCSCPFFVLCATLKSSYLLDSNEVRLDSSEKLPVHKFSELSQSECRPRIRADSAWQMWVRRGSGRGDCGNKADSGAGSPSTRADSSRCSAEASPSAWAGETNEAHSTVFLTCPRGRKVSLVASVVWRGMCWLSGVLSK